MNGSNSGPKDWGLLLVVVDSEERHLLEDIHLERNEEVEANGVLSLHCHTSYKNSLEEVLAGAQQQHSHRLVVLQNCS